MRGWCSLLSILPLLCTAQALVSGRIVDQETGTPLPYVSIGSLPNSIRSISGADGSFQLTPAKGTFPDSVHFSMVGYAPLSLSWTQLSATDVVRLRRKSHGLPELEVIGAARVPRRLGNRSHHPLFTYLLVEDAADAVIEVAQVIELGAVPVTIQGVNLYINDTPMDSATVRIGFRNFDGERPTGPALERTLIHRVALPRGWLEMDIARENIRLQGTIALTLEILPEPDAARRTIEVGIRLGGGEPAFDRRGAFEQWAQMPHRYSMNVTALVPKATPRTEPEDPDPFQHAVDLRLASSHVRDTFAIAFGLPEHHDPKNKQRYPTVYVLDANVYFSDVLELCHREARKGRLPPVLVVGIGYSDVGAADTLRERDYTIARADSMPGSGGAGHFLSFLERELITAVNARYATDTTRGVLIGHSLGGHLALAALVEHELHGTLPLDHFVAASPSVDVADAALLHALEGLASEGPPASTRVFISHGEGEDDATMRKAIDLLKRTSGRTVVERHYPGTDHMGTALASFRDGLRCLLGAPDK